MDQLHLQMMFDVSANLNKEIKMGTFTMRMDDEFKKEFSSVCQELGWNMSTVITMVGKKMIRERRIPFEVIFTFLRIRHILTAQSSN